MKQLLRVLALLALTACRGGPESRPTLEYYARRVRRSAPTDAFPRLWQVPSFAFLDALRGHVWVGNFIYTQCPTACPLLSSRMMRLQRRLTDPALRFVSFSVDPKRDTPQVLSQYAQQWNAKESRWVLVSTTEADFPRFAEGMHVTAANLSEEIVHSTSFVLVDREGWVRGAYESADEEDLSEIVHDAAELAGTPVAPGIADEGEALFVGLGCQGCHRNPRVAPDLGGLHGRVVMSADGGAAPADADYVKRAVREPSSLVVPGYLAIMPSYADALSTLQLDRLSAYVLGLPPAASALDAPATLVMDPVCGMKVRDVPGAPRLRVGDREYVFCSEQCRDRFGQRRP